MCNQFTGKTAGPEPTYSTETIQRHFCKLKCCTTCSFCARAFTKERYKSRVSSLSSFSKRMQIKICERCFLCHSVVLCKACNKCQKCCHNSTCRGSSSRILANLAESGGRSESSFNSQGGLPPPLSDPTQTDKISHSHKLLCQSSQEQLPVRGIASAYRQKCCRTGQKPNLTRVLQPTLSGPQTTKQVATYTGPKPSESLPQGGELQDGDTGNHQNLSPTRGVGYVHRLQGRLLPHPYTGTVQKISQIPCPGSDIPVQSPTLWSVHSPHGIHCSDKGSKTDGHTEGYKNPPVLRRLVGKSQVPPSLSPAYPNLSTTVSRPWLAGEFRKIGTGTQGGFQLCGLPVRPQSRPGPTHTGPVAKPTGKDSGSAITTGLSGPAVHVPDRSLDSHRKTSSPRPVTHEAHPMASQKQLAGTRITREGDPNTQISAPTPSLVVGGKQYTPRSTITPIKTCSANFYRRVKRRLGRSLKRAHCKRVLVITGDKAAYKLSGTKSSLSGLKRVPKPLYRENSSGSNRQHYSSVLHKQGRRYEVGSVVCPTVENLDLVHQETSDPQSPPHSRLLKCGSGQAIQAGPDHSDRMVPPPRGFSSDLQQVAPSSDRPFCHQIQQQTTSVCVSSTGSSGYCSRCSQSTLVRSGCLCLPTHSYSEQSGGKTTGLPMQQFDPDCPGMAQHALVLGSSRNVQPGPLESSGSAKSADTALQSDPSQKSDKSKSPCMAPRASAIKEQGFSEAVAARIEAPQRRSTRSVYEAKWTIFTKWCDANQVDFRSPPVKSVADFLMYLFKDKKLQPSTIDGYRSAIADKLGNETVNISKDDNLTRLLDSFHRDRPKGRRGIPSWNLSLVLHQLTKAPFEPLSASLKHLTFKTVFLLALGSGKRRSEIHAWQHKNIRHQSDWSKVSRFPSPSFLSKNQLAREGPESVAPVVIPALAPTLDRSLKSDRSLCPVRALRYYLDRTSNIRQDKELVFVSFKKGFDKDISPATISSWIKQTVILCYELSDHQAHTLHQVKAHHVRAFAASKAFQSGVSLEQILSACHWKSHNTFTQFYLKDVAWADSELYHLGPVVAAQQIHQQSST